MSVPVAPNVAYLQGWLDGSARVAARLIGMVAAEFGDTHPVIERMVIALGELTPEAPGE